MMNVASASNILLFHNLGTKSHLHMIFPIIDQLLGKKIIKEIVECSSSLKKGQGRALEVPKIWNIINDSKITHFLKYGLISL